MNYSFNESLVTGSIRITSTKENSVEFQYKVRMLKNVGKVNDRPFVSETISHTYKGQEVKWRVVFYPKMTKDDIGIYLELISPNSLKELRSFKFAILDKKGEELNVKKTIKRKCDVKIKRLYGFKSFIKRHELFLRRKQYYINKSEINISCKITVCFPSNTAEPRLVKDLTNMINGKYTDVEFLFKDNKITAHKCVLSARSPVFDAMFQHDFEEKKTNSVVIEDISYNTFLNMIKYIYTEVKPTMTYEETLELLVAADKYDLEHLKKKCCKFLLENIALENCLQTLVIADRHSCLELKKKAIQITKINFKQIIFCDEWKKLSISFPSIVVEFLDFMLPEPQPQQ